MVQHLVRRTGIPALVYDAHNESARWPCVLQIMHLDAQFTVSIRISLLSNGVHETQEFTLRYEGDNLRPGETSLKDTSLTLPVDLLFDTARHGKQRCWILSLKLKTRCPVWYPLKYDDLHSEFGKVVTLARATEVHIIFDTNWLGKDNFTKLQEIIKGSQQLVGISGATKFTSSHKRQDWSILKFFPPAEAEANVPTEDPASRVILSIEDAGPGAFTVQDDPPPYCDVQSKRRRRDSSPSDLVSKEPRYSECSPSPTELATPTSTPSFTPTVQVGLSKDDVTSIILEHLPVMLEVIIQKMPSFTPTVQVGLSKDDVTSIILEHLPVMLEVIVQKMLIRCSLLSPNRVPKTYTYHTPTPSPPMTLNARIEGIIKKFNEKLRVLLRDQAQDQTIKLEELIADFRSNLTELIEEHVADFSEGCNNKLEEFNQMREDWLAEVEAHALNIVLKFLDDSNAVHNQALFRYRCSSSMPEQRRRAGSLPL